ncbi:baseplate wedge subunit [Synechococcus phage S-H9-1]|uniref:Structural protein n=1 Tax=Synechococcus phage S-H9-1 TaxID=2783674 RepID=A0A873WJD6_9CAUD|nr:baseplate wedge subunit [Synechococcus phage S-H9-1]QPB08155.1 structural protein [Synechococcus phage S-H9-1]
MPVGFNSPARNLFLLGSSGAQVVTNFFKTIDQSAGTDGVYLPDEIKYNSVDQKFVLAGSAEDNNSKGFGWFEKRDDAGTADFENRIESTQSGINTTLRAMELDSNDNLIVVGKTGDVPWIAKYSNGGVIDWQSTTNSGEVEYTGVTSDSNGQYYACGNTPTSGEAQAFVEKFDASGNPGWGKSAFMLGRDVVLNRIAANARGEVVAVGYLEDDVYNKGYIVKIDTNTGEVLWDRTLSPDWQGDMLNCSDVYIDSNDQIYVTVNGTFVGYLIKYTAEGNMIWQKTTDNPSTTITFDQVKSDGETEQTIVFGTYDDGTDVGGVLSKYSKDGSLVWRRTLFSSYNNSNTFSNVCLDADPSFYYLLYIDDAVSGLNGTPEAYTFGKVSSSGNGLGAFQYAEGTGETIDYEILNVVDEIGRLSDGSVRNDTSDLITYPFNANKLLFDDLATQVTNKKRQMDSADSFEYSGSPAIRPADFQELNLLGDNVSGRTWTDTSGKGNDGLVFVNEPFFGAGGAKFDGPTNGASTSISNLVVPSSSNFQFGTGDFTIEVWVYGSDWTGGSANQDQVIYYHNEELSGFYLQAGSLNYYNGSAGILISGSTLQDKRWYHLAAVRNSGTTTLYVDGVSVGSASDTDDYGVSAITIGKNSGNNLNQFNGYLSNFRIVKGTALYTSNFTPPTTQLTNISGTVLLTCQGYSSIVDNSSSANSITITSVTPTNDGPTHNAAGYWEFDAEGETITLSNVYALGTEDFTFEFWFRADSAGTGTWQYFFANKENFSGPFTRIGIHNTSNRLRFYTEQTDQTNVQGLGVATVLDDTWHHAMFVRSGTGCDIYLDGTLDNSVACMGGDIGNAVDDWIIGAQSSDGIGRFNGDLGEFRFYPRALTATQVFQNYNATKSKYIDEGPDTAPKIGPGIVYDSNLLLNYDFGNRATYDGNLYDRYINGPVGLVSTYNSVIGVGNDRGLGNSVDVGSGKIVGGETSDDDAAFNAGQITICDLDGSNVIRVGASDAAASQQFGSGVRIYNNNIYVSKSVSPNTTLYRYDMDGTNETTITLPSTAQLSGGLFDIDKDNGKIVCGDATFGSKIHVFNSDGTGNVDIPLPSDAEDPFIFDIGHGKVAVGDYGWSQVVASGPGQTSGGDYEGRVYVYDQDGTNEIILRAWDVDEALAKYPDYDTSNGYGGYGRHYTQFGTAVGIGKDIIVVGCNLDFDKGLWAGAIYIFDHNGRPIKKVIGSTVYGGDNISTYTGSYFGETIRVTEDRIYVNALLHNNLTPDGTTNGPGAVFVFDHQGNELGIMTPPTGTDFPNNSYYGGTLNEGIAVGENKVVVGSRYSHPIGGSGHGAINIYDLKHSLPTTVKNLSSSSYTGTINGATFNSDGYFEFDNDYIDAGYSIPTNNFTVETWFKKTDTAYWSPVWACEVWNQSSGYLLYFDGNNVLELTSGGNLTGLLQVNTTGNMTDWRHLVLTIDGSNVATIYQNGVSLGSTTITPVGSIQKPLRIGARFANDGNGSADGRQTQSGGLRAYNRALSATEVSQNFNATRSKYGV